MSIEAVNLRAIIVEDEEASRETLLAYLGKYCPEIEVLATCDSVQAGLNAIRKYDPEVVFLDIEMPYGNAFDLLEQVGEVNFDTIFVTAFSNYAVRAINVSAAYYLLKPVDIDELIAAVGKVKKGRGQNQTAFHTRILIENLQMINKQSHKVVLPVLDGFEVVRVNDILRCQGNGNFTDFYLKDGSRKVICRTLKFYEDVLIDFDFMRVHRSHLVNMQYVQGYKKGKGGQLILEDGSAVEVSPNKKDEVMRRF